MCGKKNKRSGQAITLVLYGFAIWRILAGCGGMGRMGNGLGRLPEREGRRKRLGKKIDGVRIQDNSDATMRAKTERGIHQKTVGTLCAAFIDSIRYNYNDACCVHVMSVRAPPSVVCVAAAACIASEPVTIAQWNETHLGNIGPFGIGR